MLIIGSFVQNLERQESEFQSNCSVKRSELQTDVIELEGRIANGCDSKSISHILNHPFIESLERLNSAKKVKCLVKRAHLFIYVFFLLLLTKIKAHSWAHSTGNIITNNICVRSPWNWWYYIIDHLYKWTNWAKLLHLFSNKHELFLSETYIKVLLENCLSLKFFKEFSLFLATSMIIPASPSIWIFFLSYCFADNILFLNVFSEVRFSHTIMSC